MLNKEEILEQHPYSIYKNDRGWNTHIIVDGKRKRLLRRNQDDLFEALEKYYKQEGGCKGYYITLSSLFDEWFEYKKEIVTEGTANRNKSDWIKYYRNRTIAKKRLTELNSIYLNSWAHKLIREEALTKHQYGNVTSIIRQMLDYAVERKYIEENNMLKVRIGTKNEYRSETKKPRTSEVYTYREQEIIENLAWQEFKAGELAHPLAPLAIVFDFYTGLRRSELCALKYCDIHEDYIDVRRMNRRDSREWVEYTKGGCSRQVILPEKAKVVIAHARQMQRELGVDDNGFIFSTQGNDPLLYRALGEVLNRCCIKAGIEQKGVHAIRRTYISTLIDKGINIDTARRMAGHQDERVTLNSYCFDRAEERELINKFNEVFKLGSQGI